MLALITFLNLENKMKRLSAMVIALVFGFATTSVFADWAKMGVVDLQRIMQTAPQMKEIQGKLEKEFKPRRDRLVAMEEALKKDMEKFKRDSAILTDTQKKAMERKIIQAQQQFERDGQQYQQELSTAHNEAMEGLYNKVRTAIKTVAEADKFDIILQKDAAPFSNIKMDVTDRVMKEIH